MISKVT